MKWKTQLVNIIAKELYLISTHPTNNFAVQGLFHDYRGNLLVLLIISVNLLIPRTAEKVCENARGVLFHLEKKLLNTQEQFLRFNL